MGAASTVEVWDIGGPTARRPTCKKTEVEASGEVVAARMERGEAARECADMAGAASTVDREPRVEEEDAAEASASGGLKNKSALVTAVVTSAAEVGVDRLHDRMPHRELALRCQQPWVWSSSRVWLCCKDG